MIKKIKNIILILVISILFFSCSNNNDQIKNISLDTRDKEQQKNNKTEVTEEMKKIYEYMESIWDSYEEKYSIDDAEARVLIDASIEFNKPIIEVDRDYSLVQQNIARVVMVKPNEVDVINMKRLEDIGFKKQNNEWFYNGEKVNVGEPLPVPEQCKPKQPQKGKEIVVEIEVKPEIIGGKVEFVGKTNLPDNMDLMMMLCGDSYFAQDKVCIEKGSFKTVQFTDKGNRLKKGTYKLEVSSPTASVQPDCVKTIIDENGRNLSGEYVEFDEIFGKMVKYSLNFNIQ